MFNSPKDFFNFIDNKDDYTTENEIIHSELTLFNKYFDSIISELEVTLPCKQHSISFEHFPILMSYDEVSIKWSLRFKRGALHYGNDFIIDLSVVKVDKALLNNDINIKKYDSFFDENNSFVMHTYNDNISLILLGEKFDNNILTKGWETALSVEYYKNSLDNINGKINELLDLFNLSVTYNIKARGGERVK